MHKYCAKLLCLYKTNGYVQSKYRIKKHKNKVKSSSFYSMRNLGLRIGSININFGIGSSKNGTMASNYGAAGIIPINNFFFSD